MVYIRLTGFVVLVLSTCLTLVSCGSENAGESGNGEKGAEAATLYASQPNEVVENARAGGAGELASSSGGNQPDDFWLGTPRDDLERFYGLYGNPDNPGRDFFVVEAKRPKFAEQAPEIPPGYLMIGATWGDVAPWYMKALSETSFEQQTLGDFKPPEPIVVVFEAAEGQNAVAITFETVFADRGRLKRLGDVPEEWG